MTLAKEMMELKKVVLCGNYNQCFVEKGDVYNIERSVTEQSREANPKGSR